MIPETLESDQDMEDLASKLTPAIKAKYANVQSHRYKVASHCFCRILLHLLLYKMRIKLWPLLHWTFSKD